ncbi:hypothetical protein BGZ99_009851 [Dissophora globulifera]|uniref:Uncharacterized protein n=1 Tax=Dissophora globulifera TaxID=979702 RepID=A0A9P6UYU7_9FUNG|nr:hypothetical protein BGZ99_009851 [Dissophora globulifera]
MDTVAFSKGESVDATIILLAAEVGIVTFVYVVQGTLQSEFRQILWLAWTGSSRTGCSLSDGAKILNIIADSRGGSRSIPGKNVRYESNVDIPGYGAVFSTKIKLDLVTALKHIRSVGEKTAIKVFNDVQSSEAAKNFVYPQHRQDQSKVSVLWGGGNCDLFSRRVSRGITGYTLDRIRSSFSLVNIDEMKWMFVAGGIAARNKGLYPANLICGLTKAAIGPAGATAVTGGGPVTNTAGATLATYIPNNNMIDEVETTSKWRPRPAKSSRSQYAKESATQFSGLGIPYCSAVVEIGLLLQDIPNNVVIKALQARVEQQPTQKMWKIQGLIDSMDLQEAMYICQYMTLCAKLNWCSEKNYERQDLLMGMMYVAFKGWNMTIHGDEQDVITILLAELEGLDLGVPEEDRKTFDILLCLGAYLGIEKEDRRRVISEMVDKFSPDSTIKDIFSEDPPKQTKKGLRKRSQSWRIQMSNSK